MGFGNLHFLLMIAMTLTMSSCKLAEARDTIFGGDKLLSGDYLENGPYKFVMQNDCNLVLYKSGVSKWSSKTNGRGIDCYVVLQTDGNLVIYTGNGATIIWSSKSNKVLNSYRLVVQSDGNVVIYGGAIWSTGT